MKLVSFPSQLDHRPTIITSIEAGYRTAYRAMLISYSIKLAMVFVLYAHMWMFNKKRDRKQATIPVDEKKAIELGMHDVTEIDNKGFRYIL